MAATSAFMAGKLAAAWRTRPLASSPASSRNVKKAAWRLLSGRIPLCG
jgi:hypothetical protein